MKIIQNSPILMMGSFLLRIIVERYLDLDGDSGVFSYEIGDTYIRVKFDKTIKIYQYSYYKAGQLHVEKMKILAKSGNGLNSYIMRNVKNLYD
ncbi:conserved hypothetical protein [Acinetobacter baylyi ADP1]|uniref:KTSC domain-containing protein n=1 Tax=Acinetobacter baylyi (strain ATCC 33305 / BD413 / ADP1) TaxID=62977 RepID=Q6F8W6_ACIAD|nr:conserved hypothetical protein [Acinetobacter baylyi ADP1]